MLFFSIINIIVFVVLAQCIPSSTAFGVSSNNRLIFRSIRRRSLAPLQAQPNKNEDANNQNPVDYTQTQPWESELYSLMAKVRLEESWKQRSVKKHGARFLPYTRARAWARAQNMWTTEEEWHDWIESGEKSASIVPSNPEAVYRSLGTWVSWDDFLGVGDCAE